MAPKTGRNARTVAIANSPNKPPGAAATPLPCVECGRTLVRLRVRTYWIDGLREHYWCCDGCGSTRDLPRSDDGPLG